MTEPPRLLESAANPAARTLLESGLRDAPLPGSARRAALGLGLSATALSALSTGAAGAASGAATALKSTALLAVCQWLAIGAVSGLAVAGGATWLASPAPRAVSSALPITRASAASWRASPSAAALNDARTQSKPELDRPPTSPRSRPPFSAPAVASAAEHAAPGATERELGREVALIDRARNALSAANVQRALEALDEYEVMNHTGTLNREARVLRIEALAARGERGAAAELARVFLVEYPADPHAGTLQALIDSAP